MEKPGQSASAPVLRPEHFREQNIRFKFLYTFVGQLAKRKQGLDEKKLKNQNTTSTINSAVNNVHATNGTAQTK